VVKLLGRRPLRRYRMKGGNKLEWIEGRQEVLKGGKHG